MADILKLSEYNEWLRDLKQQIKTGQIKAALSVNSQMILLYWNLGRQIVEKQEKAQWGSGFIEQLSKDLREEFSDMTGFSQTNLIRMKLFYQFYSSAIQCREIESQPDDTTWEQIWAQVVPKLILIPWGHHSRFAFCRRVTKRTLKF